MCVDKKESTCNHCYPYICELKTCTRWSVGTSCYWNMYMKCILKESYYKYLVQHTLLFKYSHQHFVLQDAEENGAVEGNNTYIKCTQHNNASRSKFVVVNRGDGNNHLFGNPLGSNYATPHYKRNYKQLNLFKQQLARKRKATSVSKHRRNGGRKYLRQLNFS